MLGIIVESDHYITQKQALKNGYRNDSQSPNKARAPGQQAQAGKG
jgi:hypothetical protein